MCACVCVYVSMHDNIVDVQDIFPDLRWCSKIEPLPLLVQIESDNV